MTKKALKKEISILKKEKQQLQIDLDMYIKVSSRFLKDKQSLRTNILTLKKSNCYTIDRIDDITQRIDMHMIVLSKIREWTKDDSEKNDNNNYIVKCLDSVYDFFNEEVEQLHDLKYDLNKNIKKMTNDEN